MATPQGIVRVCEDASTVTFQVSGWGKMDMSLPIRRFAEKAIGAGARVVRFDLRECSYIDSTFLGTLLILKRAAEKSSAEFRLLSPSEECRKLLHQLGVMEVFRCASCDESAGTSWTELARTMDDTGAFHHNVAQAHRELAELGGTARETFEPVARCLEKDLKDS